MMRAFYTIDGTIIAESSGGVRTDYMHDALGSVIGTVDATGTVTNTYRWKPYGSLLSATGPNQSPTFGWLGGLGYRATGRSHADYYVRARSYSAGDATWLSRDTQWPQEPLYRYSLSSPLTLLDLTGLWAELPVPGTVNPRGDPGTGVGCQNGQTACDEYIYQIPGEILAAVKQKLDKCLGLSEPEAIFKCVGEVFKLKELTGDAAKKLSDHLWKYLRCYYSSTS
ncbi:MAG: hypothetical protein HYR64_10705 [Fimbriimonas ginsengisoli]|uniref:RHS repeat-associated core domain-containing protein n=1 Tax=Fimbriimonas ginsengisoli TaxID=1005039 RepID=A0A931PXB6_FIMGI|nr:hypothetical protein [Fimbriimonas ginsengisoli]